MKTMSLQHASNRLQLGYITINKALILLVIPIAMFILGCEQNQTKQSEPEQSERLKSEQNQVEQEISEEKQSETSEVKGGNPMVVISTSMGDIKIELYQDKAPITVQNFLAYINEGFFDGTIFHRVIPNFMIQGGGFTQDIQQKPTKAPIKNEADNGLKNDVGTISMARTGVVDSATSQFFINHRDNEFLNHGSRDFGYAVFGKVVEGMDVVNKIAGVKTGSLGAFQDVPIEPVVIKSVRVVESEGK